MQPPSISSLPHRSIFPLHSLVVSPYSTDPVYIAALVGSTLHLLAKYTLYRIHIQPVIAEDENSALTGARHFIFISGLNFGLILNM
jgi:hypothetical protein